MSKSLPKSIWLVSLLIAMILGIVLGIALPQNTLTTGIPLSLGWLSLFSLPFPPRIDDITHVPIWFIWLVSLYYPLAMLMAGVGTYWMLRSTWRRSQALLLVALLTCVSILVGIPVSLIAPSLNSNGISFAVTVSLILPVWLNLLFSAGLGWCIGGLIPRRKRETAS